MFYAAKVYKFLIIKILKNKWSLFSGKKSCVVLLHAQHAFEKVGVFEVFM